MNSDPIPVDVIPPLSTFLPLSLQHLCAMFGATILVPILLGIDPATTLLFNGIGTLIFLVICQWKVPAYLGSSFVYIAPSLMIIGSYGYGAALTGYIGSGVFFLIVALIIYRAGSGWVRLIFPDVVMDSVVTIIGLGLAPTAARYAGLAGDNPDLHCVAISLFTLLFTIICMTLFRGVLKILPILSGIVAGTALAALTGSFSLEPILNAPWFSIPTLYFPVWSAHAIIIIIPASFVTLVELFGHVQVTGTIIGKDLFKEPGLPRMLIGKGVSSILSGFFGATPNTTYSENIGVLAITRVYSTAIFGGAAVLAILFSFCGKVSVAIRCIPEPVIGGVSLILFGVIAAQGIQMLLNAGIDLSHGRNMVLVSVILIIGVSGTMIDLGPANLEGMSLATLAGVVLNLIFLIAAKIGFHGDA